jgi:protein-tyrosine phosphatase
VTSGVVNMRDLGGMTTVDGRLVHAGRVHRSGHLGKVAVGAGEAGTQSGVPDALEESGIRTVFDLRTVSEVASSPDQLPPGVELVHLDVLADATESIAAHLSEIFADPASAARIFADGIVDRHYDQTYRNLVLLDSARAAYSSMFRRLAEEPGPVLFHCTAGKDRTGWAAASLLALLGVGRETIMTDYLRSNEPVLEAFAPYLRQFAEMGGDPKLLEPAFLVRPSYLDASFATVDAEFGSIDGYFDKALDIGTDLRDRLRERLLHQP